MNELTGQARIDDVAKEFLVDVAQQFMQTPWTPETSKEYLEKMYALGRRPVDAYQVLVMKLPVDQWVKLKAGQLSKDDLKNA